MCVSNDSFYIICGFGEYFQPDFHAQQAMAMTLQPQWPLAVSLDRGLSRGDCGCAKAVPPLGLTPPLAPERPRRLYHTPPTPSAGRLSPSLAFLLTRTPI